MLGVRGGPEAFERCSSKSHALPAFRQLGWTHGMPRLDLCFRPSTGSMGGISLLSVLTCSCKQRLIWWHMAVSTITKAAKLPRHLQLQLCWHVMKGLDWSFKAAAVSPPGLPKCCVHRQWINGWIHAFVGSGMLLVASSIVVLPHLFCA